MMTTASAKPLARLSQQQQSALRLMRWFIGAWPSASTPGRPGLSE